MSEDRETRLFMISPDSMVTPDQLVRMVHATGMGAKVKETCYGCLVEASRPAVKEILAHIREKYPYDIYTKSRAYPCSDPRRCRAQHGTRPGYAQLEAEWEALPLIRHGLEHIAAGKGYETPAESEPIPVDKFKKICEAVK